MEALVIVESPTKERTIGKFLSKKYLVKSSYGHVRDLPQRKLGLDMDNDFEPSYVLLPRAKKLLPELNKAAKQAKTIFLATDYDREGEAIAWHLAQMLKVPAAKVKRITFHEITPEAIKSALASPRELDHHLVDAQVARRVLDRLVGYKLSPLLWKKIKRGLSAGRVQSVAVRLICQREADIEKFIPQEYWTLSVLLEKPGNAPFWAHIYSKGSHKFNRLELGSKAMVDEIISEISSANYQVANVEAKERRRQPSPPFTTASLQQEASHRLGFRAQRTMIVAQQLYEGIALANSETVGLITYMRTDSTFIAKAAQDEAEKVIVERFGEKFLPPKRRVFKNKIKGAQEAHEAIRPTSAMRDPESVKIYLTPEQFRLYKLIWDRFMASQMADAIYDTLTVDIAANPSPYVFRANGRTLKFSGFLILQGKEEHSVSESEGSKDADNLEKTETLPPLVEGDSLDKKEVKPEQHFTEPPPRFNEASLVKTMEELGIGRPSTYAPIIQTILARLYVRFEDRRFIPTELGKTVDQQLVENFPEIVDVNFTAGMETRLDNVADGEAKWQTVIRNFWDPFSKKLITAEKDMKVLKPKPQETDVKCDKCGSMMVVRESRFGRFLACATYPICNFKASLDKEGKVVKPEETNEKCTQCGKTIVVRYGRRGKFLACSGYPDCKFTKSMAANGSSSPTVTEKCENCGKDMAMKRGRFGEFLACTGYPDCKTIKKLTA
ncbi:MAG: DNA topoisomerase 1 [Elusimicrobia bacterium]|nr:DNA topoisomerase 1 [Elusimicrobiota bacterium]